MEDTEKLCFEQEALSFFNKKYSEAMDLSSYWYKRGVKKGNGSDESLKSDGYLKEAMFYKFAMKSIEVGNLRIKADG